MRYQQPIILANFGHCSNPPSRRKVVSLLNSCVGVPNFENVFTSSFPCMLCININHPWSTKICFLSFLKIVHIYIYNIVYSTIQKQCSPNRTGDVPSSKLTELWEIDGNCPFIHDFPMTKCQLSPRNPRKEYRKYEKYYVLSLGLDFSIFEFFLIQHKQRWLFRTVVKNPSPIEGFPPRCPR